MKNYFNYFTEIEEHFQRQRGAQILLSPLDWSLIASWREAGIPLQAVLAGIDQAFEKFNSGQRRDTARPRALAYCAAAVLEAAAALEAASVGAAAADGAAPPPAEDAFSRDRILAHLQQGERSIAACAALQAAHPGVIEVRAQLASLIGMYSEPAITAPGPALEDLDRLLTVLDDKILLLLQAAASVQELMALRAELDRDLAPYRRQLRPEQAALIERQFLHRRLLERAAMGRLSLFYMA
ncbi:MAG: hypothetical protein ACRD1E_06660 [Terriglobales bacterium]